MAISLQDDFKIRNVGLGGGGGGTSLVRCAPFFFIDLALSVRRGQKPVKNQ